MLNYIATELEHAGVKGMRWRKGRKTPINGLETQLHKKTADPNARVEKQKNLTLKGSTGKKYSMDEASTEAKSQRDSMNEKIREQEAQSKMERQEAARKALLDSINKAKKRQNKIKKQETPVETPKKTETKKTTSYSIPRRIAYINKPK